MPKNKNYKTQYKPPASEALQPTHIPLQYKKKMI